MGYRMIEAGEEIFITEEEAIKIIGSKEDFEISKEGVSFVRDDIEIFFIEL
jgi:hypothetical protein